MDTDEREVKQDGQAEAVPGPEPVGDLLAQARDWEAEYASEAGLRRAELGQEEWGGPVHPLEDAADRAYEDLMTHLHTVPAEPVPDYVAVWEAEDAYLQAQFDSKLTAIREMVLWRNQVLAAERRMHERGYQLGAVAGLILASYRSEDEGYEDIERFGAPAECGGIVAEAGARERGVILDGVGISAREYNALIDLRGQPRQNYMLGLYIREVE